MTCSWWEWMRMVFSRKSSRPPIMPSEVSETHEARRDALRARLMRAEQKFQVRKNEYRAIEHMRNLP